MANIVSTLRYDADFSSAMAQAKALAGQIGVLNMAFNSLDKSALRARNSMVEAFAGQISSMGGFTTQMVNLTSQTEKFGKALANNKLTMREYFAEAYRGYTRQSSLMKQLAREQVKFQEAIAVPVGRNAAGQMQGLMAVPTQVDFKNASTRMKLLSQEFGIFNQLVRNGADELINMGKNTQWTGRQLTVGLTMPVVLFGATFAKTFMDIDKQMTRFAKVYGQDVIGTSAAATEQMKQQVMDLAETISSRFGVAAKETVALAADVAATGKEGEDLLKTVEQTNRLAVLGEVDRQEAMKATLAIQTAFKQNTDELAESINFLNAIENQTSTTLNDLVEAIPKAGPVVKGLGGSIKDLSVLMVAMKEGGIPAAEAANAIKSGLASLINPTKKASEVAKQFGVDLVGIVEANKGQLMPTIMAVQGALNGLDAFSKSKVIEEIFGKYQFARISALFNNLGKAGSQTQQAMELAGASTTELAGIANQELKAYTESTTVRFQRMVETVKNQLIPMGASLLEMLTPALDKLSGIIDVVKNAVGNLPDFLKEPLKILGGFALFAGPILMLVGLFKNLIGNSIKFAMSVVSLGARIGGIDVRKFELLDAETAAANIQVDNLTTSFAEQTGVLRNLNREMTNYLTALTRVATQSPNMMVRTGPAPIRRAAGSSGPEMVPGGYGGGDKIPALLEPGEMVIRKEAVAKYQPILGAMNAGTLPGFVKSTGSQTVGEITGKDRSRGQEQRRFKAPVGVPLAQGENVRAAGIARGFAGLSATPENLIGLFYRDIAASINVPIAAITRDFQAWQQKNKALINEFTREFALAAGDTKKQRALIKAIDDKYIQDMGGSKSAAGRFAQEAARQEEQNARTLKKAQQILIKHGVDLNDAASVTSFYKNNLRDLSKITDKTELAAMKLLQSILSPGSYASLGKVMSATIPLLGMPGGGPRTAASVATRYQETGVPQQYISPLVRNEASAKRAFGAGFSAEVQTYMRNMQLSVEHTATTLGQIGKGVAKNLKNLTSKVAKEARTILGIKSPSTEVDKEARPIGKGIADGATRGLKKGMGDGSKNASQVGVQEGRDIGVSLISGIQTGMNEIATKRAAATASLGQARTQRTGLESNLASAQARLANMGPGFAASALGLGTRKEIESLEKRILALKQQELRDERYIARLNASEAQLAQKKLELDKQIVQLTEVERRQAAQAAATPNQDDSVATGGRRGIGAGGAMNAMFGLSMLASTATMFGDATSEATQKLSQFSMALMAVSSMMMFMPGRMPTNFLGMGSLGSKVTSAGVARQTAAAGAAKIGTRFVENTPKAVAAGAPRLIPAGAAAGRGLMAAGSGLAMLGGPIGIGIAAGVVGVTAAVIQYNRALEEARKRAVSAFSDPVKTAEYFGKSIEDVSQKIKDASLALQAGEENVSKIDDSLRQAVKEDYKDLIDRLSKSAPEAGARQLSIAFNKMLSSGLSADEAKTAVQAIAEEAGTYGANAFAQAASKGFLTEMTPQQMIDQTVKNFDPAQMSGMVESLTARRKDLEEARNLADDAGELWSGWESVAAAVNPAAGVGLITAMSGNMPSWLEWAVPDTVENLNEMNKELEQMQVDIDQMSDIDAGQLVGITEQLFSNFAQAPKEAIKAFDDLALAARESGAVAFDPGPVADYLKEIDSISGPMLARFIGDNEERAQAVMRAITAGLTPQEIQKALQEGGLDKLNIEVDLNINVQEAQNAVDAAKQAVMDLASETGIMSEALAKGQQRLSNLMTQREKGVKRFEDDAEAMAEAFEKQQQAAEDEINALEKEQAQIEKSADSYINSIQKRQQADKFYADQRKSSLDALSALAEGDVFGFLTARNEMQANAADYAYEQEIGRIEERKNLENEALQAQIDKKQEQMDLASRAHDAAMKAIEDEKTAFLAAQDEKIARQKTDNEVMSTLIDGIKNGEIQAIDTVKEHFSKAAAAKYEEAVKYQMRETYGLLQQQIIAGDVDAQQAGFELQKMMNALFPRVQSGAFNVGQSLEDTLTYLGLTPFNTAPRPNATNVGGLAGGGAVRGPGTPTSDSIPAYLSDGEYVIRASSVDKYGTGLMDAINAGYFAEGGMVDGKSRRAAARFVGRTPLGGPPPQQTNTGSSGGAGTTGMSGASGASQSSGGGSSQVVSWLKAAGWPTNLLRLAYTIVMRESGGRPDLHVGPWNSSLYSKGNSDIGLFQINERAYGSQSWYDVAKLKDPVYNAAMAYKYVSGNGTRFTPWAMRPTSNGGFTWDWSSYAGSSFFAPGSQGRSMTEQNTMYHWNRFPGYKMGGKVKKYAGGGFVGLGERHASARAFGAGRISSSNMPRYNMGGMAAMNSDSSMYNININANGIKDPMIVADIVVKKISAEKSRRSHSRVI